MSIRDRAVAAAVDAKMRLRGQPSPWRDIVRNSDAGLLACARGRNDGPVILCATSVGSNAAVLPIDSLVGTALALRGARPTFLLCDRVLPACEAAMIGGFPDADDFVAHGPQRRTCPGCFAQGHQYYRPLPIPLLRYSDFVSPSEVREFLARARDLSVDGCFHFEKDGIEIGEHVRANVLRFFGAGTLDDTMPVQGVAARYLAGALTTLAVAGRVLDQIKPECSVAHHGIYVPQGVIGQAARERGVRVVNWGPSYRNTTAIYSHGDTYHRTLMDEPTSTWERMSWDEQRRHQIEEYLRERSQGKGDWAWMAGVASPIEDRERLMAELGLDPSKPLFGLLTNVLYDANLFYQSNAFGDMLEWLFTTIDFFIERPDLQLVIRIHPHEHQSSAVHQRVQPEIEKRYPSLPSNINVVPGESTYSTYALMGMCRAVLIYGTKTGVELAPTGVPVVVAGEAWIRNKGITYDASSREEYLAMLGGLPAMQRSTSEVMEKAKRFAYHFFFRRMIPVAALNPDADWPPSLRIRTLSELLPGKDPGLDVICNGILDGKEFVYDPPD